MTQTFKTYDGVEVGIGATIYMTVDKPSIDATPNEWLVEADDFTKTSDIIYRFFSTEEACQAYIDEVNKPTPNGTINTTPTAETKPLRSFISPYLAELLSAMNEPNLITEQIGDAIVQTEPMFRKPRVVVPPTPETHPKLAESLYHPMIIDFAKFYGISPNTVFEFIINQKSNK